MFLSQQHIEANYQTPEFHHRICVVVMCIKSQLISSIKQTYSKEPTPSLGCDLDWEVLHFFPKSERAVKWGKGSKQGECNELNLVSYRNPVTNGNTRQIGQW